MDLRGKKLSDTYVNLLSTGPLVSDQTITLGNGGAVPWQANGIVVASNVAQSIDGAKTFNGSLTIPQTISFASNGSIIKAGNHAVTLTTSSNSNITFSSTAAYTYTVPNPGANASFVMTEGTQTINGTKTFNGNFNISNSQINLAVNSTSNNSLLTGAAMNYWGSSARGFNTFGDRVTGANAYNEFGYISRFNYFGQGAGINEFGSLATGYNNFGNGLNGVDKNNSFGNNLVSGAKNYFGYNSKNIFGENGENYFYSGLFTGPVTLPATVSYTNHGQIVKSGNHSLGLTTTAGTTGTFPTGNINIASLEGTQTFVGEKKFSSGINILKTTDQLVLGNTTKLTISSTAPASDRTYIIPAVTKDVSFILSSGTQTIEGTTTFTSTVNASITGNAGSTTNAVYTTGNQTINGLKTFTQRPFVNGTGILMSGDSLIGTTTQYSIAFGYGISGANFTWNGNQDKTVNINTAQVAVLTGDQTIGGKKTFTTGLVIQSTKNQLTLGTGSAGSTIDISAPTIFGNRTYTLPDVGGNASFVMTNGSQDITGVKTFANQVIVATGSNQLVLRTGSAGSNSFTISAPTIFGNRTYTLPDVGENASFVMTTGSQTIGGVKNFTSRPTVSGLNVLIQGDTSIFTRVEAPNLLYNTGDQNIFGIKSFIGNDTGQLSLRTGVSGSSINISAPEISGNRTYTVPDVSRNASFVMTEGSQIINGRKRFRNASIVPFGPFVNDVDADFNGLLSSREVYFTDDGSVKSAVDIPSLDIVYETGATSLKPRIGPTPTFSRTQTNTSGTYLDLNGYIQYVGTGVPRFECAISKNLLPNSKGFTQYEIYPQSIYGINDDRIMIRANTDINPYKSMKDAVRIIDVTGISRNYDIQQVSPFVSGLTYTMSVFAKPINNNFIRLQMLGSNAIALFDLSSGLISGISGSIVSSGIDNSYGNGWNRIWLSATHNAIGGDYYNVIKSSNFTGANVKTITTKTDAYCLWGPQIEIGSMPTQYQEPIGGSGINAYSRITPKGLLIEKSSTNSVLFSNNFIGGSIGNYSLNGYISLTGGAWPDGSGAGVSGSVYVENDTISQHTIYRHPISGITSATNYVSSIFLKQPISGSITGRRYVVGRIFGDSTIADTRVCIDLDSGVSGGATISVSGYTTPSFYTGIRYPNNWYRLIIGQITTGSASSGISCQFSSTTGFGVDIGSYQGLNAPAIQIFGHQIEALPGGDSATSYKPTTGTSGILGRDMFKIEGNDFSDFYNQNEGTFFIEAELLQNNTSSLAGMMGIEGASRPSGNYTLTRDAASFLVTFSSGPPNYQTQASFSKTTGSKELLTTASYKEDNFKTSFYNEILQTDTSGRLGSQPMNRIVFGANGENSGPQSSNMYLKRFSYWPLQLQNTKLTGIYRY